MVIQLYIPQYQKHIALNRQILVTLFTQFNSKFHSQFFTYNFCALELYDASSEITSSPKILKIYYVIPQILTNYNFNSNYHSNSKIIKVEFAVIVYTTVLKTYSIEFSDALCYCCVKILSTQFTQFNSEFHSRFLYMKKFSCAGVICPQQ